MMKKLIAIFLVLSLVSCNQNQMASKEQLIKNEEILDKKFGKQLIDTQYIKYAETSKIELLQYGILNSFNIYEEDTNKYALVDEENIAEFTFDAFMHQIEKMLEKRNIKIKVEVPKDYEKTYSVIVNNEALKLYIDESQKEKSLIENSTSIFFKKLNEILKQNSCKEKFYLLYGGNDLGVFLLDEKQFEIIKERYKENSGEIPYLP